MLSWSVAVASRSRESRGKLLRFCQRNSDNPFADGGTHFGKIFFHFQDGGMAWLTRPRNDTFDLEHGSPGCHRPEAKEAVRRPTTKNAEARFGVPLVWGYRSPERASALYYFQSLSKSSMALSRAVFIPFSMMLIISFPSMDYCFFLFFFFFSFSRSEV